MAVVSYYVVPEDKWLSRRSITRMLEATEGKTAAEFEKEESTTPQQQSLEATSEKAEKQE